MSKGPVEEFTVGGGDVDWGPSAEMADAGPARRPWQGPVAWASCAVVLVLIGIVIVQPLHLGTEPWGEVADITSTPREAWTVQPEAELHSALLAGGVLITAGVQTVHGLDPSDGDVLWELPMAGARCTTDTENLVCTDAASQVLQIDPRSGDTTALDVPDAIVATVVDGDVFAVTRGADGQVQRISGGEVLWSTPVTAVEAYGPSSTGLTVIAGHVLTTLVMDQADFGATGAVFDAETGQQWDEQQRYVVELSPGVWLTSHRNGGTVFVHGVDQPSETVGAAGFLQFDDQWRGSEQVGTTENDELGIVDRETGDWLWHTDYPAYPMARAAGVLFALIADGQTNAIQGLSSATGELLWEHANTWLVCPCLSDGSTLAGQAYEIAPDGSTSADQVTIVGLGAHSGEEVWSLPRPPTMVEMLTDGRHLIAVSPQQVRAWELG